MFKNNPSRWDQYEYDNALKLLKKSKIHLFEPGEVFYAEEVDERRYLIFPNANNEFSIYFYRELPNNFMQRSNGRIYPGRNLDMGEKVSIKVSVSSVPTICEFIQKNFSNHSGFSKIYKFGIENDPDRERKFGATYFFQVMEEIPINPIQMRLPQLSTSELNSVCIALFNIFKAMQENNISGFEWDEDIIFLTQNNQPKIFDYEGLELNSFEANFSYSNFLNFIKKLLDGKQIKDTLPCNPPNIIQSHTSFAPSQEEFVSYVELIFEKGNEDPFKKEPSPPIEEDPYLFEESQYSPSY